MNVFIFFKKHLVHFKKYQHEQIHFTSNVNVNRFNFKVNFQNTDILSYLGKL